MSEAVAESNFSQPVKYQYNKLGNVRAPLNGSGDVEVLLDLKLVQQPYATPDYLTSLGGEAAEARAAGFSLSFQSAQSLGIETLNEMTGQWRAVASSATFAVVASLQ